jgi:hypothetical protein
MAMRCLGRARLAGAGPRALDLSFFRAVDLAAAFLSVVLRDGDFFNAAVLAAVREFGFFLAIAALPGIL